MSSRPNFQVALPSKPAISVNIAEMLDRVDQLDAIRERKEIEKARAGTKTQIAFITLPEREKFTWIEQNINQLSGDTTAVLQRQIQELIERMTHGESILVRQILFECEEAMKWHVSRSKWESRKRNQELRQYSELLLGLIQIFSQGNDIGKMLHDLKLLLRVSGQNGKNLLLSQNPHGPTSFSWNEIPQTKSSSRITIRLSRDTQVLLSRKGGLLHISSHTKMQNEEPNEIHRDLKSDEKVMIGRDLIMNNPLGLNIGEISICDWGLGDASVSRAGLMVHRTFDNRVYLIDLQSTNSAILLR